MIGKFRHRITLQEEILTPDGSGGFIRSWKNITENARVFARMTGMSGYERLRFHQLTTSVTHKIIIRYRADVTAKMRIVRGNVTYDIISVVDRDGRKEFLNIFVKAITP